MGLFLLLSTMAAVYILFSKFLNRHYIGSCANLQERLQQHNSYTYQTAYTTKAPDWELIHSIDHLEYQQARNIEAHIKRMKSVQYIFNLTRYPEMSLKLVQQCARESYS